MSSETFKALVVTFFFLLIISGLVYLFAHGAIWLLSFGGFIPWIGFPVLIISLLAVIVLLCNFVEYLGEVW